MIASTGLLTEDTLLQIRKLKSEFDGLEAATRQARLELDNLLGLLEANQEFSKTSSSDIRQTLVSLPLMVDDPDDDSQAIAQFEDEGVAEINANAAEVADAEVIVPTDWLEHSDTESAGMAAEDDAELEDGFIAEGSTLDDDAEVITSDVSEDAAVMANDEALIEVGDGNDLTAEDIAEPAEDMACASSEADAGTNEAPMFGNFELLDDSITEVAAEDDADDTLLDGILIDDEPILAFDTEVSGDAGVGGNDELPEAATSHDEHAMTTSAADVVDSAPACFSAMHQPIDNFDDIEAGDVDETDEVNADEDVAEMASTDDDDVTVEVIALGDLDLSDTDDTADLVASDIADDATTDASGEADQDVELEDEIDPITSQEDCSKAASEAGSTSDEVSEVEDTGEGDDDLVAECDLAETELKASPEPIDSGDLSSEDEDEEVEDVAAATAEETSMDAEPSEAQQADETLSDDQTKSDETRSEADNVIAFPTADASNDDAKPKRLGAGKTAAMLGFGVAAATAAIALKAPGIEALQWPGMDALQQWRGLPEVDLFLHHLSELKRYIV